MREAGPGDLIFSFVDTLPVAIGVVEFCTFKKLELTEFGDP
jgi:hypothetical protein